MDSLIIFYVVQWLCTFGRSKDYANHVVYKNQVSVHAQTNSLCVARAETEFDITKAGSARNMFASRAQKEHSTPRGEYVFCARTNVYISERGNTVFASRAQNIVFTSCAKQFCARAEIRFPLRTQKLNYT